MQIQTRRCLIAACLGVLVACAGPEPLLSGGDRDLLPRDVVADPQRFRGHSVQWGGLIVSGRNLRDHSELEILAYPLHADGRPDREKGALGRFFALRGGYVETAEFAPGKLVTVVGPVLGLRVVQSGGQSRPFAEIDMQEAHLWKVQPSGSGPSIHFGIGVGSWGSSAGVGVGF